MGSYVFHVLVAVAVVVCLRSLLTPLKTIPRGLVTLSLKVVQRLCVIMYVFLG